MPELPEVEVYKQYVDATSLHKEIKKVEFGDDILFNVSNKRLKEACVGKEFTETQRMGKHLLMRIEGDGWVSLHFGMTGGLEYYADGSEKPDYRGLVFHFKDGYQLAFTCVRKLGRIGLVHDPETFQREKKLGADALQVGKQEFIDLMQSKKGMIKTALMDQSAISGIGNIYSDEILFQSGIHPKSQVSRLSKKELDQMFDHMQEVFSKSIEQGAEPSELPKSFIIPKRKVGAQCPNCDGKIEKIKVGGRSTYFCGTHQKIKEH